MAIAPLNFNTPQVKKKSPYAQVSASMVGTQPAFARPPQTPVQAPPPTLPQNYGFNDLAGYEENRRNAFGQNSQKQILDYGKQYANDAATRRSALSSSLTDFGQKQFDVQNPKILEDLNSRGLFTSPSAVANAQAQALKEISLANQQQLFNFDNQTFNEGNAINQSGLSASLQGGQDALDSGLDLRRGGLEAQLQQSQAAQEQALAEKLAKEQGRNQLTNSLIGAGGSLLGGSLAGGKDSLVAGLLGKGAATTAANAVPTTAATTAGATVPAAGAGLGSALAGGAAVGGAGIGAALLSRAAENKIGDAAGQTAGNVAGIVANPIGAQLNVAKGLVTNPGQTVSNLGNSVKSAFGGGKTQNGGAIADVARNVESQSNQAKQLLSSGDTDNAIALLSQVRGQVERAATTNKTWAESINPFWQQLQNEGIITAQNGKWVLASTGQEIPLG